MTKFNELKAEYLERLELYVPVVARVHGESHPEFYKVKDVYHRMNEKLQSSGSERPELEEEFKELRTITSDYKVPEDTCETYEAVYNMLGELDRAYMA